MPVKHANRQIFVALAIITNEQGEILLGKRHDPRNKGMHDRWEFPGGKVEFGEHPRDTTIRESQEEVALTVIPEKIMDVYSWFHPDRPHIQVVLMVYRAHTKNPEHARPNCKEIKDVRWVTIEEALTMNVIDNNKIILEDLKKSYN